MTSTLSIIRLLLLFLCGIAVVPFERSTAGEFPSVDSAVIRPVAGEQITSSQLQISDQGQLVIDGASNGLTIDDVRQIEFAERQRMDAGPYEIILRGGSSVFARTMTLADEKCRFANGNSTFELSIEAIAGIRLDTKESSDLFAQGVGEPLSEYDKIYIRIENQLQAVTGVVEAIQGGTVTFLFDDEPRELSAQQVYGVVIADFGAETPPRGNATATLSDGSQLVGRVSELNDESLVMIVGNDVPLSIDRSTLQTIDIRSDRLLYLSDIEPITAQMRPIVTAQRDWERDLSVDGNPLTLRDPSTGDSIVFEKGIGTHSETILEFSNEDAFDRFNAIIGIDAETEGKGDCEFVVLGDGKELFNKRITASDEPFVVDLDVSQAKVITLHVRPGNQLDLADHANWCEARLLRARPRVGSSDE